MGRSRHLRSGPHVLRLRVGRRAGRRLLAVTEMRRRFKGDLLGERFVRQRGVQADRLSVLLGDRFQLHIYSGRLVRRGQWHDHAMGTGKVNGSGVYTYRLTAFVGRPASVELQVWNSSGALVYDLEPAPLKSGSITIK